MISGTVTSDGVPKVVLTVAGHDWPAVVDTGFNGDLELPESLQFVLKTRFTCRTLSLLASGQQIVEAVFLVDFQFDGETGELEATFAPGDEILIGTHLLKRHRVLIDFVRQTVLLERANY